MTNPIFDLLTEPWIPVVIRRPDGGIGLFAVGLMNALKQAHEVIEMVGDNPLETVALHRLLLAVLHRTLGPADETAWKRLWDARAFDMRLIEPYFDRWRDRFDLFDAAHPFYQTADLDLDKAGSIAKLMMQADNNPALFDHAMADRPPAIEAGRAARILLVGQSFLVGGRITGEDGGDSARAGLLVQSAVALVRGESLFETLLLNLHQYSPETHEEPWRFVLSEDRPAWERETPTRAVQRLPDGYCDLLSWQSRQILLFEATNADGPMVNRAVVMKGCQLPPGFDLSSRETMVAFQAAREAKPDEPAWRPLGFKLARAAWRDSAALLMTTGVEAGNRFRAPRSFEWLARLNERREIGPDFRVKADMLGLAVDQAKCLFWRHDRVTFPVRLLGDEDMIDVVRQALTVAEAAGEMVGERFAQMPGGREPAACALLLVFDRTGADKPPDMKSVSLEDVSSLGAAAEFWTGLEVPFQEFLFALGEVDAGDEAGRQRVLEEFRKIVREQCRLAFRTAGRALGSSSRHLAAVAKATRVFNRQLALLFGSEERTIANA
jgi:CRISPR system Cascade subunit CasA